MLAVAQDSKIKYCATKVVARYSKIKSCATKVVAQDVKIKCCATKVVARCSKIKSCATKAKSMQRHFGFLSFLQEQFYCFGCRHHSRGVVAVGD
jgi:hypothetical protein